MKIPMTEKVCQLYEEKKVGKGRDGRKVVTKYKMPDLGWDIAETQLQTFGKPEGPQEQVVPETTSIPVPLQTIITIVILITTIVQHIQSYVQRIARKTTQVVNSTTTKISRKNFIQDIRKTYNSTVLAITIATKTAGNNQ